MIMTSVSVMPSASVLQKFYLQSNANLKKTLNQKLVDSNHMRSTAVDPYHRNVVINDMNLLNFSGLFSFSNSETERQPSPTMPIY